MKKWYTLFYFLCLTGMLHAQNIGFKYNNSLRFLNATGDTLTNPFTGGFNAPQFNMIDINLDGKLDLLVFDRSGNILHPYINMGNPGEINYRYAPEYRNLFPRLINWVRIADYNHDGKMDIFTNADPNEPHDSNLLVQINHVRIFKNVSSGSKMQFNLISPSISCEYWYGQDGVIVSPTDLPDVKDIDGDGDMDMVSIQNTGAFIYYFKNYQIEKGLPADSFKFYNVDTKWGGVMITDQITLGQTVEKSYFKTNHTSGTTVSLFDKDGDGDYDLYTGDPANDFLFYVKNGRVEYNWKYNGYSSDTMVAYDSITPRNTIRAKMPAALAAWFVDIDNDGKQDLIVSPNTLEGAKTKNNIWLYLNTGTVANAQFSYIKNNFLQEACIDLGTGLAPAALDYDQDGDIDIIAATKGDYPFNPDETGRLVLLKNHGSTVYPVFSIADTNFLQVSSLGLIDMKVATGDVNGDGKADIVLTDYDGSLVYLENNTSGTGLLTFKNPVTQYKNINPSAPASPAIFDLNHDGMGDIVLGLRNGYMQYFRNTGNKNKGADFSPIPVADSLGLIRTVVNPAQLFGFAAPCFFNFGHDSTIEMVTGSYGGLIKSYRVQAALENPFPAIDSVMWLPQDSAYSNHLLGYPVWCSPLVANFDNDTIPDLIVGMHNGGLLYFKGYFRGNMPYLTGYDTVRIIDTSTNTGIVSFAGGEVLVFPNPFCNKLTIMGNPYITQMILTDLTGKTVTEVTNSHSLPIDENLRDGMYFLIIRSGEKQTIKKVIKQRD